MCFWALRMGQNECCSIFQGRNIRLPAILMAFQYSIVQPIPEPQDRRWQLWYHAGFSLPHGEPGELRDPRRHDAWQKNMGLRKSQPETLVIFSHMGSVHVPITIHQSWGRSGNGMGRTVFALWHRLEPKHDALKSSIFSLQQSPNTSCSFLWCFFLLVSVFHVKIRTDSQPMGTNCSLGPRSVSKVLIFDNDLFPSSVAWSQSDVSSKVSHFFWEEYGGISGYSFAKLQNRSGISMNF